MNKLYIPFIAAFAALGLASCGGEKDKPEAPIGPTTPSGVEVTLASAEIETKAATLEFGNSAKMNIFAKTYNRIDAPNIVDGVCATLQGGVWTMEPKVYINESQKNAFVYAVAPYDPSYTDAENIPVDLDRQVDLMYSGAYKAASLNTPQVKLTMRHALSLLSFNIVPVNYTGAGNLTMLKIEGDIIYKEGKMNASTGDITLTNKGAVQGKMSKTIKSGGWTGDLPGLWSLPFNNKTGSVKLTATIDGKNFETFVPEVEVKTGWQYIFRLVLTNNGLEIDPSKTETKSLNVVTDEQPQFEGFGSVSLVASGSWMNSPMITGDAVFGTLVTPSGASSYEGVKKVEGLKGGDKVTVESWNSNGFALESLDGVQTIDVSMYE